MPKPSKSMPMIGHREATPEDVGYRSLEVRASTLNVDARTIQADIATEAPVPMVDWERMAMVPEILIAAGAQFPKSRQVPFLDSHNRNSVSDQLGSARDVEVKGDRLRATLHFSESATNEFTKVREGHVTDVSAGYEILKRVHIPAGESKTLAGRQFDGPVNVVTKWRLREVSLTPIGADAQAKLRGLDPAAIRFESRKGQFKMNEDLRKLLVSRGMAADLTDEQAQQWLVDNREAVFASAKPPEQKQEERKAATPPGVQQIDTAALAAEVARQVQIAQEDERKRTAEFRKEVDALCDLAGLASEKDHCRGLTDVDAVRSHLIAKQKEQAEQVSYNPNVRVLGTGFDRLRSDLQTALALRAVSNVTSNEKTIEKVLPVAERAKGASTFRHASLFDMASEFVRASGIDTRGLTREEVALCAMFGPEKAGIRSAGAAYHTTGSFTNLTLDAVNKSMQVGYTETPVTWRGPMRQGSSVADFKQIHRIRLGSVPNLPVWNDNSNPEKGSIADGKESYAVECRSLELDFSYRLLINDDMDALSRIPSQMGAAAARTVNTLAWTQVTSNPTMSDSVALFAAATGARKRTNLTTGAGSPSVSTLQTLSNLMRQMRGENTPEGNESTDILNLMPRYLIGPSALETTIKQLVLSAYDPASSLMVYNTATQLIPVIEPLLDASSTTAWYVFADPSQIDTVEVTFLQGQETPVVRSFMDERKMSQSFIVLQTVGAKPLNHRGVQKHAGA